MLRISYLSYSGFPLRSPPTLQLCNLHLPTAEPLGRNPLLSRHIHDKPCQGLFNFLFIFNSKPLFCPPTRPFHLFPFLRYPSPTPTFSRVLINWIQILTARKDLRVSLRLVKVPKIRSTSSGATYQLSDTARDKEQIRIYRYKIAACRSSQSRYSLCSSKRYSLSIYKFKWRRSRKY